MSVATGTGAALSVLSNPSLGRKRRAGPVPLRDLLLQDVGNVVLLITRGLPFQTNSDWSKVRVTASQGRPPRLDGFLTPANQVPAT